MKTSYRILIVDDEDNVRRMLATAFSLQGHETHCASNGQAALQHFADTPPDVVLMDIRMPEMDGYEACRQIRGAGRRDSLTIPIVAMTANAFSEDIELAGKSGMNAHLAKPVDAEQMISLLKEVLAGEKNG